MRKALSEAARSRPPLTGQDAYATLAMRSSRGRPRSYWSSRPSSALISHRQSDELDAATLLPRGAVHVRRPGRCFVRLMTPSASTAVPHGRLRTDGRQTSRRGIGPRHSSSRLPMWISGARSSASAMTTSCEPGPGRRPHAVSRTRSCPGHGAAWNRRSPRSRLSAYDASPVRSVSGPSSLLRVGSRRPRCQTARLAGLLRSDQWVKHDSRTSCPHRHATANLRPHASACSREATSITSKPADDRAGLRVRAIR